MVWDDEMRGVQSRWLGAAEYRKRLSAVGLTVTREYDDEGENYYFDAIKDGTGASVTTRARGSANA